MTPSAPQHSLGRASRKRRTAIAALVALAACAPAAAVDEMARRARACTVCHGEQGRAAADGYHPRIAGKPAGYLLEQLRAFREGRRTHAPMTRLIDPLDDGYLRAFADHFAALDLPYPPPQAPTADAAQLARGRLLALQGDATRDLPACAACHGEALTGIQPGVPGLLGLPRDYLNAQLGAWRLGARRARAPDCMAEIARRLDAADVAALSQWLAAQPLPRPAGAVAAAGKPLPLRCGSAAAPR